MLANVTFTSYCLALNVNHTRCWRNVHRRGLSNLEYFRERDTFAVTLFLLGRIRQTKPAAFATLLSKSKCRGKSRLSLA